jgi:PAS domain S-box-containing protein
MDQLPVDRRMTAAWTDNFAFQYRARRSDNVNSDDVNSVCHDPPSSSDKGIPAMTAAEKLSILFISDQPAKRLTYQNVLEDLGDSLITVRSIDEGLDLLNDKEIAVVLIDLDTPQSDAPTLAAEIRQHARTAGTAIIFISPLPRGDIGSLVGSELDTIDYVSAPVVPDVLRLKIKVFAELFRKTRQFERLNVELERRVIERTAELESYAYRLKESERRRDLALVASEMGSWDWDLTTNGYSCDEGQFRIFGVDADSFAPTAERFIELLEPEDRLRFGQALESLSPSSPTCETEFRVRARNGELRCCLARAGATFDSEGRIARISGVCMDITERKQAQQRQLSLTREVEHRARNLLAVVQSMLRLTKAPTKEAYISAVEGRINALSRAHILLSESRWEGACLRRLVGEELDHCCDGQERAVEATGPELLLNAAHAQTIALALHELATNAIRHGALSVPTGKLSVAWREEAGWLRLDWVETGAPRIKAPATQGYGMQVTRVSIQHLGGNIEFDWGRAAMRCTISVPLGERNDSKSV